MNEVQCKKDTNRYFSWYRNDKAAMIGLSLRGKDHISHQVPLQDYHLLRILPNGWLLAVVCDGVGSEPYSDVGSVIAAKSFADFICEYWGVYVDEVNIHNIMKSAALFATGKIKKKSEEDGNSIYDYSTTLHAVIFADGIVYFFHSGDGGIVAMFEDGNFSLITEPQKGSDKQSVIPLLSSPAYWQIGTVKKKAISIMLCTDGLYDKIVSTPLKRYGDGIDKTIAAFYMSPWVISQDVKIMDIADLYCRTFNEIKPDLFYSRIEQAISQGKNNKKVKQFVNDYVYQNNRPLKEIEGIRDDITAAIIVNTTKMPARKPIDYYKGPNWEEINLKIYNEIYNNLGEEEKCITQE